MAKSPGTQLVQTLEGHQGPVHTLSYNSNGQYALSGGQDRSIKLWNPNTGGLIKTYSGHGWEVLGISVSHDNTRFASCGGDKSVFLWDVTAGATIRRFAGHFQRVNCVAFNQESTVVASGSYDSTVRLWDCKSQNRLPLQLLEDATDSITALQIQNAEVITASVDGHVRIYDLRMGQLKQDYIGQPVVSITCSKDGATYLATTLDSTHRLMDKDDGHMLQVFKGHKNTDYRLHSTLSRDDAYVVSGSEDGSLVIWDVLTGDIKSTIPTAHGLRKSSDGTLKPNVITWVECHPSSEQMLSAGTDGSIRVYK